MALSWQSCFILLNKLLKGRKVICSRDLFLVLWAQPRGLGLSCLFQCWWVKDAPVSSLCSATSPACLGSPGETCTSQNHPACVTQPICQACCSFGPEVSLCFMKMFCQPPWCLQRSHEPCVCWAAAFGNICAAEVAMGTLLFSAWKLRQRGWVSDPTAATDYERLVMGLTALSQVLGSKG